MVANAFAFHSDIGLGLFPSDNDTVSLSQILSSPTSNGPMEFSFTYDDSAGLDPADLTVSLNGVLLTDLSVNSTAHNTFQTIINNPALENLTNAKLTFTATPTGTLGVSFVGLGSITLEAVVPEPASASLSVGLVAMSVLTHRRRMRTNGPSSHSIPRHPPASFPHLPANSETPAFKRISLICSSVSVGDFSAVSISMIASKATGYFAINARACS